MHDARTGARTVEDIFGVMTYPGDGYAYRGPEFLSRFNELLVAERRAPDSLEAGGWLKLPSGRFRTNKIVEKKLPIYIQELIGGAKWLVGGILVIYLLEAVSSFAKKR